MKDEEESVDELNNTLSTVSTLLDVTIIRGESEEFTFSVV